MKNFEKLAEELSKILPSDKELGYETGAQLRVSNPKWIEKNNINMRKSVKLANEAARKDRMNNPEKYKIINKAASEKRKQNKNWREKVGKYVRDEKTLEKYSKVRNKRVKTPKGIFESRNMAAKHYNTDSGTIGKWITSKPDLFYYVDQEGNRIEKASYNKIKKFVTPDKVFDNKTQALKHLGISSDKLKNLMIKYPDQYYYKDQGPGKPINHNKIHTAFGEFVSVPKAHDQAILLGLTDITSPYHWFKEQCHNDPKHYYKLK